MSHDLNCKHYWIPNGGRGGEPEFRENRQLSASPLMYARCDICGARTWFTKEQWNAIPTTSEQYFERVKADLKKEG